VNPEYSRIRAQKRPSEASSPGGPWRAGAHWHDEQGGSPAAEGPQAVPWYQTFGSPGACAPASSSCSPRSSCCSCDADGNGERQVTHDRKSTTMISCCLPSIMTHQVHLHISRCTSREFPEGDDGFFRALSVRKAISLPTCRFSCMDNAMTLLLSLLITQGCQYHGHLLSFHDDFFEGAKGVRDESR